MKVLVLGGTRFFGVHMVEALLGSGHEVTIATRGQAADSFGQRVERIKVERSERESLKAALSGKTFDVACDNLAYCSNDVKKLLEVLSCRRYIMTSSSSVYENLRWDSVEEDFDPAVYGLKWLDRIEGSYEIVKRQAEAALFQVYNGWSAAAVRFPYVIGEDDYTKRLYFYVEHVIKQVPMHVDNLDAQMGFVSSGEAGQFLAWLAEQAYSTGTINACSTGTVSLREVISYVEMKTGRKSIFSAEGEAGPYNGTAAYRLSTEKAGRQGFCFTKLQDWIYKLLDRYIDLVLQK